MATLLLPQCFLFGQDSCSCRPDGVFLDLPCRAAVDQLESIEVAGACQDAEVNRMWEQSTFGWSGYSIWIRAHQAGNCQIKVRFKDGTTSTAAANVHLPASCCLGYYADVAHSDFAVSTFSACPDAGVPDVGLCGNSPAPAGCFTMAAFDDCNCRCKGYDIPVVGEQSLPGRQCTRACACGLGPNDLVYGCSKDDDCQLVRADCCGCATGGVSTAVLKADAAGWDSDMSAQCPPSGVGSNGCSTNFLCGQSEAICSDGRCAIGGRDAW